MTFTDISLPDYDPSAHAGVREGGSESKRE